MTVGRGWDLVCCFAAIEHVPQPAAVFVVAGRRLAADGTFIVSTHGPLATEAAPWAG